jgi:uncharacterized Zn finger protein (UPF0148 family)
MTDSIYVPRPGRPKQLYCPDCKREGNPFVKKKPGQGYCPTHHSKRTKESYQRRMRLANPNYVPRETLAPTLEEDIKAFIKAGREPSVEMIQSLYLENGLPVPDEEDVIGKYYPHRYESEQDARRVMNQRLMEAAAEAAQLESMTPED